MYSTFDCLHTIFKIDFIILMHIYRNRIADEIADEDSDDELTTITGGYHTGKVKRDLMLKDDDRRSSFFKKAVAHPMYPFSETRIKWDEYGEIIKYELLSS